MSDRKLKLPVLGSSPQEPKIRSYEAQTQAYSTWGGKLLQHTDVLYSAQKEKVFKPITIQLGPTEACDSNCPFCSVSWRDVTKKIPFPTIKKLLEDFSSKGAKSLELSVRGNEFIPYRSSDGFLRFSTIKEIVGARKDHNSFTIGENLSFQEELITDWVEHPQYEPLWKVTLEDGRNITVTKSHSIFFFEDNKVSYKPLSEAKKGDLVVILSGSPSVKFMEYINLGEKNYKITGDFCRLLGYFIAEGSYSRQRGGVPHGISFTFGSYTKAKEKKYVDDVMQILKNIGFSPSVDFYSNKTTIRVSQKAAYALMHETDMGTLAVNKKIPDLIFNTTRENQIEFLKGLYGGDGNFRNTKIKRKFFRNSLEYRTASRNLQISLAYLLDLLEIKATFSEGKSKKRFIEGREIPETTYYNVHIQNKTDIMNLLPVVEWLDCKPIYSQSVFSHTIPKKKRIKISDSAFALRIKSIEELKEIDEKVYDISVGNTHRFESSFRILCHNTGAGNPLIYKDGDKNINDVVEYAHSLGYEIGIITNTEKLSRHLKPENADKISWIRISLIKLDEGKTPEDYDFSGFPLNKLGFSYIIYEGTTRESIEKIARLVELNPEIKFVRIASDCLTEESLTIKENWGGVVQALDTHQKFFIKEINDSFHAFEGGCWVGAFRPYVVWNGVYICTSHVLKHRNYHPTWKLCEHDQVLETWDKMGERYKQGLSPYDVDIKKECFHCYYAKNNELLSYVMNDLPDKNFP